MATDAPSSAGATRPRRRYLRFSLRTLLIVLTLACLWFGWQVNSANRQKRAVEILNKNTGGMGFRIYYDWQNDEAGDYSWTQNSEDEPGDWQKSLGIDYFHSVTAIEGLQPIPELLVLLNDLPRLRKLTFQLDRPTPGDSWRYLASLRDLRQLHVGSAVVTDESLAIIGDLKRLVDLSMVIDKEVTVNAGQHLAKLKNLEYLSLKFADDVDPDSIAGVLRPLGTLRNLKTVVLSFPGDTALAGLDTWAEMHSLDRVAISESFDVTGEGLKPLALLPNVRRLGLSDSPKVTLEGIAGMRSLESLNVMDNGRKTTAGLRQLETMPRLRRVWLNYSNSLTGATNQRRNHIQAASVFNRIPDGYLDEFEHDAPADSGSYRNLKGLWLFLVWQIDPNDFRGMSQVEFMAISNSNRLLPADPQAPLELDSLRSLQISAIPQVSLTMINSAPQLKSLKVNSSEKLADDDLAPLDGNESIEDLTLTGVLKLTDDALLHVGRMKHLKRLELDALGSVDAGLANLASLAELETLELSRLEALTGPSLVHLGQLKDLRSLGIKQCRSIDFKSLPALNFLESFTFFGAEFGDADVARLASSSQLRDVEMQHTSLTDAGLAGFATLPGLKSLELARNPQLTDAAVTSLSTLTQLEKLLVPVQLSEAAVDALRKALPNVEITQEKPRNGGFF